MKKLTALLIAAVVTISQAAIVNAQIYTTSSSNAEISGGLTAAEGMTGYGGTAVQKLGGSINWTISGNPGVYRLWYWCPLSMSGAESSDFVIDSEFLKTTLSMNFAEGKGGWREITLVQSGMAGMTVTARKADKGETYASAIRFEKLDDDYIYLWNYVKTSPKHIILSPDSKCVYVNGLREKLTVRPVAEASSVYVACRDLNLLLDGAVHYTAGKVTYTDKNGKAYTMSASDTNSALKTINGVEMINLSKIYNAQSKSELVYNNSLFILSDAPIGLNAKTDAKQLKTILTVLRFEK